MLFTVRSNFALLFSEFVVAHNTLDTHLAMVTRHGDVFVIHDFVNWQLYIFFIFIFPPPIPISDDLTEENSLLLYRQGYVHLLKVERELQKRMCPFHTRWYFCMQLDHCLFSWTIYSRKVSYSVVLKFFGVEQDRQQPLAKSRVAQRLRGLTQICWASLC